MATNKQRREAERRHLQRQMERRQAQQHRRRRVNLIISVVGTIVAITAVITVIAVTSGGSSGPAAKTPLPSATPSTTTSTAAAASYPCTWTKSAASAKSVKAPASTTPPKTGTVSVTVATTQGTMTFALNRSLAPCTVASFVSLVQHRYYDSSPCHRLTTAGIFVLQCGDATGTGTGGPGYTVPDEATGNEKYPAGTIAMARSSMAHSGGSQFFIVYKDSPNLMQQLGKLQYTVFGKVSSGLDVVTKVAAKGAATGTDGKPKLPITLTKLTVIGK